MSPLHNKELQRLFESIDRNGDGQVSIGELEWLLGSIGVETNADELVLLTGEEALDFDEFSCLLSDCCRGDGSRMEEESYIYEAFKVFDRNGDGFLSPEEIVDVLSRLGMWEDGDPLDCGRIIGAYDLNSDGVVDFEEFKRMMVMTIV